MSPPQQTVSDESQWPAGDRKVLSVSRRQVPVGAIAVITLMGQRSCFGVGLLTHRKCSGRIQKCHNQTFEGDCDGKRYLRKRYQTLRRRRGGE